MKLKIKFMGFFKGLIGVATSPITLVKNVKDKIIDEDWEFSDVATLGLTKVVDATKDTADEIADNFEE